MNPGNTNIIEADASSYDDGASDYGSLTGSDTTSVSSSIFNFRYESGRRYHAYQEGSYPFPNDESEADRYDLNHHVYTLVLGGELLLAPVVAPQRILDIGTGTGIWAIGAGDRWPAAAVVGTDLSPIQPSWVPPNVHFEIDDAELDWTFTPKSFDVVHTRHINGGISNWPKLVKQAFRVLRPNGWYEAQDIVIPLRADDGSDEGSMLVEWNHKVKEAADLFGKRADYMVDMKANMEAAGFVDVKEVMFKVPTGPWPKDPELKKIGVYQHVNISDGLQAVSMALFTRSLKWTAEEVEVYLIDVRKSHANRKHHTYHPLYVVYGRKPEENEAA